MQRRCVNDRLTTRVKKPRNVTTDGHVRWRVSRVDNQCAISHHIYRLCDTQDRNMLIGYMRVSTQDQNLALQADALAKAGCEKVFEDKASGARADRPGLAAALSRCRQGDVLVVYKLDRMLRPKRSSL